MRYLPDSPILCGLWISPLIFFIIFFLCFFPHLLCQFTHQIHRSCAVSEFLPSSSSSSFFVLLSSTPLSIYPTDSPILLLSKYKWLPPPFKMPPSSSSSEKLLSALPCLAPFSSFSLNKWEREGGWVSSHWARLDYLVVHASEVFFPCWV